jgi:hypothetical protein
MLIVSRRPKTNKKNASQDSSSVSVTKRVVAAYFAQYLLREVAAAD